MWSESFIITKSFYKLGNILWMYVMELKTNFSCLVCGCCSFPPNTTNSPLKDSGQIHLKYTLLPFHYRVTNENSILNALSGRQGCSFFCD